MEDSQIVNLYLDRSESAIFETKEKYHSLCFHISNNIIKNELDAWECENDTYLKLWNSIPPTVPNSLKAYLVRIVRNLAIDRFRKNGSGMRGCEVLLVYEELEECIVDGKSVVEDEDLADKINGFLGTLDTENRILFIRRYWQTESVVSLAKQFGLKESALKMRLMRTREKFREYLDKEGVSV